uniref:Uncharacterized protein n=1 Tax=Anophryoides haemophila TaxID=46462 RepID=A0A7S3IAX7_9CILI|mmetsp:Transcript_15139/g.2170  ORF Transcript_15139/g.2170 Transcript_15139/m.2170 type:complete len:104 (+) Transcript_15139:124-435(+)
MVHTGITLILGLLKNCIESLKENKGECILNLSALAASWGWWIGDMVYKWRDYEFTGVYAALTDMKVNEKFDDLHTVVTIVTWFNIVSLACTIIGIVIAFCAKR